MFVPRRRLAAAGGGFAALALLSAGCGGGTTAMSGRVAFKGAPVPGGSVILYCADKQIVYGVTDADGRYTIPSVPRGPAVVTVQTLPHKPYMIKHRLNLPPTKDGPAPPPAASPERVVALPPRYALPEESGLAVVVDGRNLTHDIDLRP
jgi:hypothetical protein